jgi:hypothetical protein
MQKTRESTAKFTAAADYKPAPCNPLRAYRFSAGQQSQRVDGESGKRGGGEDGHAFRIAARIRPCVNVKLACLSAQAQAFVCLLALRSACAWHADRERIGVRTEK